MPRLFTGLEVPAGVRDALSFLRGGLPGARFVEPENYHLTLRFVGDVDGPTAEDFTAALDEARLRPDVPVRLDALDSFGGDRPRALIARAHADEALLDLQAEHERLARRAGLAPETRRFAPHVTLARLGRGTPPGAVAAWLAERAPFAPLAFTASRAVLYSARESTGGGPYVVEATYPFGGEA
jgi:RNA 2',3'-cyclic 3'-phosphodiesterase